MRYAIALSIYLQLLLGACATQPSTIGTGQNSTAEGVAAARTRPPADNPYLRERRSAPVDAQRQFERAQVLIEGSQWQGALQALQELAHTYPQLSGPGLNLALVYQQLGDSRQARYWFQLSIAANSGNIAAYNEYGIFLRKQGHFKEAETAYLQALDEWDASADTHRNIGILYDLYLGERNKALQHYYRYQSLTGEQDNVVAGWISDLERQSVSMMKVNRR